MCSSARNFSTRASCASGDVGYFFNSSATAARHAASSPLRRASSAASWSLFCSASAVEESADEEGATFDVFVGAGVGGAEALVEGEGDGAEGPLDGQLSPSCSTVSTPSCTTETTPSITW